MESPLRRLHFVLEDEALHQLTFALKLAGVDPYPPHRQAALDHRARGEQLRVGA
jgi:hypothetical protein